MTRYLGDSNYITPRHLENLRIAAEKEGQDADRIGDPQPAGHDREKADRGAQLINECLIVKKLFTDRTALASVFSAGNDDVFFQKGTVRVQNDRCQQVCCCK